MIKKFWVRALSLFCITILALSLLSACSTGNKSGKTSGESTGKDGKDLEQAERKTIDISIWQASVVLDNVEGIKNDRVKEWVEDKFNVRINLMTGDFDKIKLLISTGQAADITAYPLYFGSAAQEFLKKTIKEDMLYDLSALIEANPEKYSTLAKISKEKEFKFFNHLFSDYTEKFHAVWSGDCVMNVSGAPIYNMRIMNDLNLKIPETVDEFVDVLRAIKKGKPDIIPFNFVNWKGNLPSELEQIFFNTHGTHASGIWKDNDGKWYDATIDPENKEVWKLIQKIYKEDLIDKETFTKEPYYHGTNDFANDKVAVITFACPNANTGMYTWLFGEYKKVHPDATIDDVVIQPNPLEGPGGSGMTYGFPFSVQTAAIIPKTCKNPERALELINWFWSDEGQITKFYGIEGTHHTKDSSGNLVLNKEEWDKDTEVWALGGYHGMFFSMVYASGGMVQYDKYGWYEGHMKQQFIQNERTLTTPDAIYADEMVKKWQNEAYTPKPFYSNYVNLSEDQIKTRTKLSEIRTKYFTQFLFGDIDVDAGWDQFVNEYKEAGAESYLKAYVKAVEESEKLFESIK